MRLVVLTGIDVPSLLVNVLVVGADDVNSGDCRNTDANERLTSVECAYVVRRQHGCLAVRPSGWRERTCGSISVNIIEAAIG